MTVEVPHEVALFLNVMGVPYPDIDEDQVRALASRVRDFATRVDESHQSATGAVEQMGAVYSGASYTELVAAWARMSAGNVAELDRACRVAARVLDAAAQAITVLKTVVLTELAALAAGYTGLLAVSVATAGTSAALTTAFRTAASKLVSAMGQMLLGYIIADVIGKAVEPLEDVVADMVDHAVDQAANALDVPPPGPGRPELHIDPDEVRRYAQQFDVYADEILDHAQQFADDVATLDFTTPGHSELPGESARSSSDSSGPEREFDMAPTLFESDSENSQPSTHPSEAALPHGDVPRTPHVPDSPAAATPAPTPAARVTDDTGLPARDTDRSGAPSTTVRQHPTLPDSATPTKNRAAAGNPSSSDHSSPAPANRLTTTDQLPLSNLQAPTTADRPTPRGHRTDYPATRGRIDSHSTPQSQVDNRSTPRDQLADGRATARPAHSGPRTVDSTAPDDGPQSATPKPKERNTSAVRGEHRSSRRIKQNSPISNDIGRSTPWNRSNRAAPSRSAQRPAQRRADRRAAPPLNAPANTPWSTQPTSTPKTKVFAARVDRPPQPGHSRTEQHDRTAAAVVDSIHTNQPSQQV